MLIKKKKQVSDPKSTGYFQDSASISGGDQMGLLSSRIPFPLPLGGQAGARHEFPGPWATMPLFSLPSTSPWGPPSDLAQQPCLWEELQDYSCMMTCFYSYLFLIRGKDVVCLFFTSSFDHAPSSPPGFPQPQLCRTF